MDHDYDIIWTATYFGVEFRLILLTSIDAFVLERRNTDGKWGEVTGEPLASRFCGHSFYAGRNEAISLHNELSNEVLNLRSDGQARLGRHTTGAQGVLPPRRFCA